MVSSSEGQAMGCMLNNRSRNAHSTRVWLQITKLQNFSTTCFPSSVVSRGWGQMRRR